MRYTTVDGLIHEGVQGYGAFSFERIRGVHLACGNILMEEKHLPPWIYKRETRQAPTCVRCIVGLFNKPQDLKRGGRA